MSYGESAFVVNWRYPNQHNDPVGPVVPMGGDPEATAYYRLWDCCGNVLNQTYDTLSRFTNAGTITAANETVHSA